MDGAGSGRIGIDGRVRHVVARGPGSPAPMPEVPGAVPYAEPLPDRIGHVLRDHRGLAVAGGVLVGVLTAGFSGGGLLGRGVLGGIAGLAAPLLGATLIGGLTSSTRLPAATAPWRDAATGAAGGREELRVMSFNVREAIGATGELGGGERVLDALAAEIAHERPDVVLLQEVTDGSSQGRWKDVPAELAERLHPTSLDVGWSGTRLLGFQKGNAVMTFGDARVVGSRVLQLDDPRGKDALRRAGSLLAPIIGGREGAPAWATGYNARSALDAIVETGGGARVRVVSTHLGGDEVQALQLDPLAAALGATDAPTILAGDFNTRSDAPAGAHESAVLGAAGLADAFTARGVALDDQARRSFPATGPRSAIDRIYTTDDIEVRSARVTDPAEPSSDHRAVVADVTLR